jgi:hypothetical protein
MTPIEKAAKYTNRTFGSIFYCGRAIAATSVHAIVKRELYTQKQHLNQMFKHTKLSHLMGLTGLRNSLHSSRLNKHKSKYYHTSMFFSLFLRLTTKNIAVLHIPKRLI